MTALSVHNISVSYGPLVAVRDLSFEVPDGRIVALIGANGAGKTTVIRAVAGLIPVRGGGIELNAMTITRLPARRRVKLGIVVVQENRELFRSLNVEENLRMGAYLRHDRRAIEADLNFVYDLFPALTRSRHSRAGALSGGQAQMLAIGRALMSAPKLLLLDEPSHGLAPILVEELFQLIARLPAERALSVLLAEQNAARALETAGYGYVLETGTLALEGPTQELVENPRVKELYLGG